MRNFAFACLSLDAAEQNFEEIEGVLSTLALACEELGEPEKSVLISALQTNGLKMVQVIPRGVIFDLDEWAKVFVLIETQANQELDLIKIESLITLFVSSIGEDYRVYADDGSTMKSFVNTRTSLIVRFIRSKVAHARKFKEERE